MIDQNAVRELLNYDPDTGVFIWRARGVHRFNHNKQPAQHNASAWNARFAGKQADSINTDTGYARVGLLNERYLGHRLAWLYMTGCWPKDQIDHIDGHRANNRWCNLREANNAQNNRNGGLRSTNTSGYKGVYFNTSCKKWQAQITVDGRVKYLGIFFSPEKAHRAYEAASKKWHGSFGRVA